MDPQRPTSGSPRDGWLLRAVDAGLVATLVLGPLLLGGRTAVGQLVLVGLVLGTVLAWLVNQGLEARATWARSPWLGVLVAAVALACLQVTPLPAPLLDRLSPGLREALPMWGPGGPEKVSLGSWRTLSLAPARSRDGLVLLASFVLLFVVTGQRVRRIEQMERLIRWIAVSTIALACWSLVHYFAGNGKYFWFYEHPYARPNTALAGPFTNRNHFAHFVAIGMGPMFWWLVESSRRPRSGRLQRASPKGPGRWADPHFSLRCMAVGVAIFAGLLTLSRGGALAIVTASAVAGALLVRGSLIRWRSLVAVAGTGMFVAACLGIYGYRHVANRLDDFRSIDALDSHGARRQIWQADLAGVRDFPLFGTGLASHRETYPRYLPERGTFEQHEATHAESGYVQIALETGLAGLLLLAVLLAFCVAGCVRCVRGAESERALLVMVAVAPALAASFVHSLVDYVWYVPGCMVAVVMLGACLARLAGSRGGERFAAPDARPVPRAAWLTAAGCLLALGGFMLENRLAALRAEPHWHRYLQLSRTLPEASARQRRDVLEALAASLKQAVRFQPDHPRAHARLASVHLQLFDCPDDSAPQPFDVHQVRDAVLASRFPSAQAMDAWLERAFGPRRKRLYAAWHHARRAIEICPLQGEVYLYLGQLAFLGGPEPPPQEVFLRQALEVRPFSGPVLLAAGQHALLAGDGQKALDYWKQAFRAGRTTRDQLLELLAGRVAVAFLLDEFQPDETATARLAEIYRQRNDADSLRSVQVRLARLWERKADHAKGEEAVLAWLKAAKVYGELDQQADRLRCAASAVGEDGSSYEARYLLGQCLLEQQRYTEAEEQLRWCLRFRPDDRALRELVERAVEGRLRMTRRPRAAGAVR